MIETRQIFKSSNHQIPFFWLNQIKTCLSCQHLTIITIFVGLLVFFSVLHVLERFRKCSLVTVSLLALIVFSNSLSNEHLRRKPKLGS